MLIVPRRPCRIPLRNHKREIRAYTLVDFEDYHRVVAAGPWYKKGNYVAHAFYEDGKKINVKLHRFIMNQPRGTSPLVDHINGNELDNRKINLRISTYIENGQNRKGPNKNSASKYRGVSWNRCSNKWQAEATLNRKKYFLGRYTDEAEAGRVAAAWRAKHMPFSKEAQELA